MSKKSTKLEELYYNFRKLGISPKTVETNDTLLQKIKKQAYPLPDYRHPSYIRHLLGDIIMIVFFALLGKADKWGKSKTLPEKWLRK